MYLYLIGCKADQNLVKIFLVVVMSQVAAPIMIVRGGNSTCVAFAA